MKDAGYGAILHDGWSKFSQHYVALFATYNKTVSVIEQRTAIKKKVPSSVLLDMFPMSNVPATNDEASKLNPTEDTDATTFTAEVHAKFFRDIFLNLYDTDIEEWSVCQTADNATVNKKVARLLGIPHIPCNNHLFNSEV